MMIGGSEHHAMSMIFSETMEQVQSGNKFQTTRVRFPFALWQQLHRNGWQVTRDQWKANDLTHEQLMEGAILLRQSAYMPEIKPVVIPVRPARTASPAGFRPIRILDVFRRPLLTMPSHEFINEGFFITDSSGIYDPLTARSAFAATWDRLNDHRGLRWSDNPLVYVIRFELVSSGGTVDTADRLHGSNPPPQQAPL
jgi:hypothetical protein